MTIHSHNFNSELFAFANACAESNTKLHFAAYSIGTDAREANIHVVGNWRMTGLGDLNQKAISLKEVGGREWNEIW